MAWKRGTVHDGVLGITEPLKSLGPMCDSSGTPGGLIPTTSVPLLAAIGIAGMDRALQANIIAKGGKAVEPPAMSMLCCLTRPATITIGNRRANKFHAAGEVQRGSSGANWQHGLGGGRNSEGKSIVKLALQVDHAGGPPIAPAKSEFVAFSAQTRMSGIDVPRRPSDPLRVRRRR